MPSKHGVGGSNPLVGAIFFINKILKKDLKMIKNNYYKEIISNIENFINKKEYVKASKIIEEELKMPYIPFDVEKKINLLKNNIDFFLIKKNLQKDISFNLYIKNLFSNKYNFFEKIEIIESLDYFDLKSEILVIKNILLNQKLNDLLKFKLLLILKKQEINIIINILLNSGKKESFDLKRIINFYESKEFAKDSIEIENYLFKDPMLKNLSFSILEMIYLLNFKNNKMIIKNSSYYLHSIYLTSIFFKDNDLKNAIKKIINNYDFFIFQIKNFLYDLDLKK
ncbi:MAG: hypothetical protein HCTKY_0760 [Candidatus Hepatoplasma crinochetorum]|nr:MAG: hypothetical protein HCTKY_0760 [Candidatus Hepatoplasma crinochetorum]